MIPPSLIKFYTLPHSLWKYKWHPELLSGKMLRRYSVRLRIYSWPMIYLPPHWRLRTPSLISSGDVGRRQQIGTLHLLEDAIGGFLHMSENDCVLHISEDANWQSGFTEAGCLWWLRQSLDLLAQSFEGTGRIVCMFIFRKKIYRPHCKRYILDSVLI